MERRFPQKLGLWGTKIAIPPEKCEKMLSLLKKVNIKALVERRFPQKLHEQIQGLAVYMTICCKSLHAVVFRLFAIQVALLTQCSFIHLERGETEGLKRSVSEQ